MLHKVISLFLILLLSGCATIERGIDQNFTVMTTGNQHYNSTVCRIDNEEGYWLTEPGQLVKINRDGNPLNVVCKNETQQATGSIDPEFSGLLLYDEIIAGFCIVSCFVDTYNNAFYEYPRYISIEMSPKIK